MLTLTISKLNLGLPALILNLQERIHPHREPKRPDLRVRTLRQPPLVVQQQIDNRNLDLIRRKEPSGARVLSVSEPQVVGPRAHQLRHVLFSSRLAHVQEPSAVPFLGFLVHLRAPHVVRRHAYNTALGNDGAVRQLQVLVDVAAHRDHGNGLDTLGLLDDAVEQLHLVKRRLLPPAFAEHLDHLLAQGGDELGVLHQVGHHLAGQVGGGVDGGERHTELRNRRVVVLALGGALEPLNRVVVLRLAAVGCLFLASLLEDGVDDGAGLSDLGAGALARGEEPVDDGTENGGPHAEFFGGAHAGQGVLLRDLEPVLVSAEFFAEEDAGGDAGDEGQDFGADVDGGPFAVGWLGENLFKCQGSFLGERLGDLVCC